MVDFSVTVSGGDGFLRANPGAAVSTVGDRLKQRLAERVAARAQTLAPRDTGFLGGSIQPLDGIVTVGAPYAAEVHGPIDGSGRGGRTPPRLVPIDDLRGWALRHGLPAGAVQWSIAERGTPYQPFLADAIDQERPNFPEDEQLAAAELAQTLLGGAP